MPAIAGQPAQSTFAVRVRFVFVAAHDRQDVARLRIGDRDAGVRGAADRHRDPRHDLERNALLVEEQRFFSAAVEDERIAPLQTDDGLAVACLFGKQKTDRVLLERLGRRRADVNPFRVGPRAAQQPRVDPVIVNHDVSRLEVALPSHADERRIPGPAPTI